MSKKKLYIIIPAYNEEETIENVINQWYPVVEKYDGDGASRLVIINDGSKDKTEEIANSCKPGRPLLEVISKENGGHGSTVLFGYKYAIEKEADYIFQTDSDGQTDPAEFDAFWNCKEQYDMVIGHRCGRQDGFSRVIVTKTLKLVIKLCFGVTVTDANTPFRLIKTEALKEDIHFIPNNFNLSNVIQTVVFTKKKRPIKYIKITFKPRQGGVNSINIPKIIKIGARALKDFRTINKCINETVIEAQEYVSPNAKTTT